METDKLTTEENRAIQGLQKVAEKWPATLALFASHSSFLIMRVTRKGRRFHHEVVDESGLPAVRWPRTVEDIQTDTWRESDRGSVLLEQWGKLSQKQQQETKPAIQRALNVIMVRAFHRAQWDTEPGGRCPEWLVWADSWLSGDDRTEIAARKAWEAAAEYGAAPATWVSVMTTESEPETVALLARKACAASKKITEWDPSDSQREARAKTDARAEAEEDRLQAEDIRQELSEWPEAAEEKVEG